MLSERQRNRRVEETASVDLKELLLAAAKSAKNSNEMDVQYVLRLMYNDLGSATKICSLLKTEKSLVPPKPIDNLRGLTYFLDNKFTTSQYKSTRLIAKEHAANIFPSYHKIAETKKECRPPVKCNVSDVSATLPLQALLNHTAHRLLSLQEPVFDSFKNGHKNITVKLQVKWGCDGSADHSQYNQKYVNVESTKNSDANFFATTLVPLRITETKNKIVIWNNSTPQSPRWCRPLRLQFAKETEQFTIEVIDSVQNEVTALTPFTTTIAGVQITVIFELYLTMIDGKALAAITKTASKQRCCICGVTPSQVNKLDDTETRFKPKEGSLVYGMSVLHLWIRAFEWLLHVSYRRFIGKWQLRGADLQKAGLARKNLLQDRFWQNMGIRVDYPSTGGTGNSNNGNVSRTAFEKPELLANILELDLHLIQNIRTILIALSCQLPLNVERFHEFCQETSRHYVTLYGWYPLPPSIHKVLVHSKDIMLANDLAVGLLAEDASESCNKLYRHNRQFHARKNSRQNNLEDVFNRALDSSDPIVASFGLRKRQNDRTRKMIPREVLNLLEAPKEPAAMLPEDETEDLDATRTEAELVNELLEDFNRNLDDLSLPKDPYYEEYDDDNMEFGDQEDHNDN